MKETIHKSLPVLGQLAGSLKGWPHSWEMLVYCGKCPSEIVQSHKTANRSLISLPITMRWKSDNGEEHCVDGYHTPQPQNTLTRKKEQKERETEWKSTTNKKEKTQKWVEKSFRFSLFLRRQQGRNLLTTYRPARMRVCVYLYDTMWARRLIKGLSVFPLSLLPLCISTSLGHVPRPVWSYRCWGKPSPRSASHRMWDQHLFSASISEMIINVIMDFVKQEVEMKSVPRKIVVDGFHKHSCRIATLERGTILLK